MISLLGIFRKSDTASYSAKICKTWRNIDHSNSRIHAEGHFNSPVVKYTGFFPDSSKNPPTLSTSNHSRQSPRSNGQNPQNITNHIRRMYYNEASKPNRDTPFSPQSDLNGLPCSQNLRRTPGSLAGKSPAQQSIQTQFHPTRHPSETLRHCWKIQP